MNLMCTKGMEDKVGVTDCMDFAIVVYHGNSLCERHFNMKTTKIMSTNEHHHEWYLLSESGGNMRFGCRICGLVEFVKERVS